MSGHKVHKATITTPLLPSNRSSSPRPPRDPSQNRFLSLKHLAFRRRRSPPIHFIPAAITSVLFVALLLVAWDVSSYGECHIRPFCRLLGAGSREAKEVWWRNAGPYAPRRSLGAGGGMEGLPKGCEINQVSVLHRHAARYPTTEAGKRTLKALDMLRNRSNKSFKKHPELSFLDTADLQLKSYRFDHLTDQGKKEAWRSGKQYAAVYKRFLDSGEGLFTRSAGGGRVVETGSYWLQGFQGMPFKLSAEQNLPEVDVIIPEGGMDTNNTLSVHNCKAYEDSDPPPGTDETKEIHQLLKPTLDRLNSIIKPSPALKLSDLPPLADMCGYDSQAFGQDWTTWSRWCGMFTAEEWEIVGYSREVARYYQVGQGSTWGETMGAGYIQELVARMSDTLPSESGIPTINRTLDSDASTFPPGGRRLFVDFTHDNEMIQILTALGVIKQYAPLSTDSLPGKRAYILSELIPFGSQVVFERIGCETGNWEPDPDGGTGSGSGSGDEAAHNLGLGPGGGEGEGDGGGSEDGKRDYVRVFINDKIHKVDHVDCKMSVFAEHGMCELESFVSAQDPSLEADWTVCTGNSSSSSSSPMN